jgi:hypothetical protein
MIFYQKSQVIFGRELLAAIQGILKKPRERKWLPRNFYKRFLIRNHLEGARSDFYQKNSFGRKSPSWADLNQKSLVGNRMAKAVGWGFPLHLASPGT